MTIIYTLLCWRVLSLLLFSTSWCLPYLSNSQVSELYIPTFRNTLFHLRRQVGMKNDWGWECWGIYTGKGVTRKQPKPNLFPYKYPNILNPSHSSYLPTYEDGTECYETSAYKIQTLGNYPEESIEHPERGEGLKSRIVVCYLVGAHISLHSLFVVICCYILLLLMCICWFLDQLHTNNWHRP